MAQYYPGSEMHRLSIRGRHQKCGQERFLLKDGQVGQLEMAVKHVETWVVQNSFTVRLDEKFKLFGSSNMLEKGVFEHSGNRNNFHE
eukprot:scaffold13952_cov84-Cylindrotheca_fusiformis.AAC.1